MTGRGAEAYRQAYEYISAGGLYRTERGRRRAAMRYLMLTASPPLSPEEKKAARKARTLPARNDRISPAKH